MDNTIVYYAFFTHDGKTKVMCEPLNPFLMMADYLLFSSKEACVNYWEGQGFEISA